MFRILEGLSIVEGSAFIAAPTCGMTFAQLGAEVIRFDLPGGGIDYHRWPVREGGGASFYWAGLNKAKKSIVVDFRKPEGRELLTRLITRLGDGAGMFVTNFAMSGWLDYGRLSQHRKDLIALNITGNRGGGTAVDYTVNAAVGYPMVTGTEIGPGRAPVNNVVPAWDFITGQTAALGLLAAERHRRNTGAGQLIRLALSDVALFTVAATGHIAEALVDGTERPVLGNDIYGAFGRDFACTDGRRVMVVTVSESQWTRLVAATGIAEQVALLERAHGLDLRREEARFEVREEIAALVAPWCAARPLAEVAAAFDAAGVCWGPYQSFRQLVAEDPRCSPANPMFAAIDQPGLGKFLAPGSPLEFGAFSRTATAPAPVLGQHTEEVLAHHLGLGSGEIARLHDTGIVAGPARTD